MKFWIVSFFMTIIGMTASAQLRVGNGGEGIIQGEKIIVRELLEYSIDKIFVGDFTEPLITKILDTSTSNFLDAQQKKLLARKLTDINQFYPFLGQYLATVFVNYDWSFTNQNLVLLPETYVRISFPNTARVQIANRYLKSILISKPLFNKMDDLQQIALIIHELTYAITAFDFPSNGAYRQNLGLTRQVVADFMKSPAQKKDPSFYQNALLIPPTTNNVSCLKTAYIKTLNDLFVVNRFDPESLSSEVQKACSKIRETPKGVFAFSDIAIFFNGFRPSMKLIEYKSDYGLEVAFRFYAAYQTKEWYGFMIGDDSCESELTSTLIPKKDEMVFLCE